MVLAARLDGVHVSCPGRVVSYDADAQTADVQPMVKARRTDAATGEVFYQDYPTIPNVRVRWPKGGGFGLTLPLAKDDFVELVFGDRPNSEFRATGDAGESLDAERHGVSAPWAYPTSGPDADVFAASSASKAVFGHQSGARIEFTSTVIDAGPSGAALAHSAETAASIAALQTAVNAICALLASAGGAATGLAPPGAAQKADIQTVASGLSAASGVQTTLTGALAAQSATLPTTVLKGK